MNNSSDMAALLARSEALERERAELARLALIGQAFIGLTHELNNALNSMMLQTSVVQMRVDEQIGQELAAIRQHGTQAAGLVRTLQHAVQERRENTYPVDLNSVLAEILEQQTELHRRLTLCLSPKPPVIQNTRSAVTELVRLLLEGVCTGPQAMVKACTNEQDGCAVLSLTIAGAEGEEPTAETLLWQNLDGVGRLAGRSLLRQLGGALTVERTVEGPMLHITWRQSA